MGEGVGPTEILFRKINRPFQPIGWITLPSPVNRTDGKTDTVKTLPSPYLYNVDALIIEVLLPSGHIHKYY